MTLGLRWPSVSRPFSLGAGIVFLVGVKTLHATSLQCRNATVYGLITTAAHGMSIPPASTTSPNPSRTLLILKPGASQSRKRSGTCMVLHLLLLLWRWVRQQVANWLRSAKGREMLVIASLWCFSNVGGLGYDTFNWTSSIRCNDGLWLLYKLGHFTNLGNRL